MWYVVEVLYESALGTKRLKSAPQELTDAELEELRSIGRKTMSGYFESFSLDKDKNGDFVAVRSSDISEFRIVEVDNHSSEEGDSEDGD